MRTWSILLKKVYLFLLIMVPGVNVAMAQESAGEDKTICNSDGVVIGFGQENPAHCYQWNPETGLSNPRILHPVANPSTTTNYTLTVVGEDFVYTNVTSMTVFVKEAEVTLTVENNLTECMAGRQVTFTAEASDAFPDGEDLTFTFHFQHSDGSPWIESFTFDNRTASYDVVFDALPPGSETHQYATETFVEVENENCKAQSAPLPVEVYELSIEFISDAFSNKPWKVVVGDAIAFSATASTDCNSWKWEFPDGRWRIEGGNSRNGNNMVIPFSTLNGASNADFGDIFGSVMVSCTDGDGNEYSVTSTNQNPPKKAKIFFDPDKNRQGEEPTTNSPPCWFVFWKDGLVVDQMNLCGYAQDSQYYGYWDSKTGVVLCDLAATTNGPHEYLTDMSGNQFTINGTGKHLNCVAEVIAHEKLHSVYPAIGQITYGINTDTDGLPDLIENNPEPMYWYFKASNPYNADTFGYFYAPLTGPGVTYDFSDQEVRCRIEEISGTVPAVHPERDWSQDSENPNW